MFLVVLIFASLVAFVYLKVQQSREVEPLVKRSYSLKSSIAIGIFLISFGINSYMSLQSSVAAVVALIFLVVGSINVFFGWKQYRLLKNYSPKETSTETN
ncbi:YtpI family protein [Bacillus sp. A116_S68]|nr:YtpI family protein [Bacillus sp. A116_S68]